MFRSCFPATTLKRAVLNLYTEEREPQQEQYSSSHSAGGRNFLLPYHVALFTNMS